MSWCKHLYFKHQPPTFENIYGKSSERLAGTFLPPPKQTSEGISFGDEGSGAEDPDLKEHESGAFEFSEAAMEEFLRRSQPGAVQRTAYLVSYFAKLNYKDIGSSDEKFTSLDDGNVKFVLELTIKTGINTKKKNINTTIAPDGKILESNLPKFIVDHVRRLLTARHRGQLIDFPSEYGHDLLKKYYIDGRRIEVFTSGGLSRSDSGYG
jgi:hypothetical protein